MEEMSKLYIRVEFEDCWVVWVQKVSGAALCDVAE
jgi:hypothetical protein